MAGVKTPAEVDPVVEAFTMDEVTPFEESGSTVAKKWVTVSFPPPPGGVGLVTQTPRDWKISSRGGIQAAQVQIWYCYQHKLGLESNFGYSGSGERYTSVNPSVRHFCNAVGSPLLMADITQVIVLLTLEQEVRLQAGCACSRKIRFFSSTIRSGKYKEEIDI